MKISWEYKLSEQEIEELTMRGIDYNLIVKERIREQVCDKIIDSIETEELKLPYERMFAGELYVIQAKQFDAIRRLLRYFDKWKAGEIFKIIVKE